MYRLDGPDMDDGNEYYGLLKDRKAANCGYDHHEYMYCADNCYDIPRIRNHDDDTNYPNDGVVFEWKQK